MDIAPVPTDEEAAAIVVAVDALWPRPAAADDDGAARPVRVAVQWAVVEPADPAAPGATVDLTTVDDESATFHDGTSVDRVNGLEPDTRYELNGAAFRTLPRPTGALHCRLATVNDVHFGEIEAGRVDGLPKGPVLRVPDGSRPVPGDDEPRRGRRDGRRRPRRRRRQG